MKTLCVKITFDAGNVITLCEFDLDTLYDKVYGWYDCRKVSLLDKNRKQLINWERVTHLEEINCWTHGEDGKRARAEYELAEQKKKKI